MNIEQTVLPHDLQMFGNSVPNFPDGVKQGFDGLVAMLPEGLARSYYGLSWMEGDAIIYYTMAAEQYPHEAGVFSTEKCFLLEKGNYLSIRIENWMTQTSCIKDAFHVLMQDNRVAAGAPCVEWYKSDQEMLCMMKASVHSGQ